MIFLGMNQSLDLYAHDHLPSSSQRHKAMNEPTTLLEKETVFKRYQRRLIFNQLKFGFEVATGFKVAR